MVELDEIDGKLIELLQRNGRASNIELARQMGVSEGTIRRRFRNLVKEEVIRVVAIPDASKLGEADVRAHRAEGRSGVCGIGG